MRKSAPYTLDDQLGWDSLPAAVEVEPAAAADIPDEVRRLTAAASAGVASVACIGNRVYTGLEDDELYFAVPGATIHTTLDELQTILHANEELEKFHRQRAAALAG